jgi:hypothetical protein
VARYLCRAPLAYMRPQPFRPCGRTSEPRIQFYQRYMRPKHDSNKMFLAAWLDEGWTRTSQNRQEAMPSGKEPVPVTFRRTRG